MDGVLIEGRGVTAELLERSGVRCEGVEGAAGARSAEAPPQSSAT